jgi:hypothetical protein
MSAHSVHDRFQLRELLPVYIEVQDTHTLGREPGTYAVKATCTDKASAVLIRDLLNNFYKGNQ